MAQPALVGAHVDRRKAGPGMALRIQIKRHHDARAARTAQSAPNFATMTPSKKRSAYEGALCECGKKAHRYVGRKGFCLDHTADAFAAQAKSWKVT